MSMVDFGCCDKQDKGGKDERVFTLAGTPRRLGPMLVLAHHINAHSLTGFCPPDVAGALVA